jgi:hypothetical protein
VHPNGQKSQISNARVNSRMAVGEGIWRGDGKEVFYNEGGDIMAVEIGGPGSQLQPGPARKLFHSPSRPTGRNTFIVSRDGQRFLMIAPEAARDASLTPFVVIVNWPRLLDDR